MLGGVAIGGGGMFATFSYINPMMTHLAGYSASSVTFLLVLFGLGMTAGNLVGARLADRAPMPTLYGGFAAQILVVTLFVFTSHSKVGAAITIFLYPASALIALPTLQTRMITLAGGAPNLAAAAIQGGFNVANSLGAWLGGIVIAAGFGYDAPNVVAIGLTVIGLGFAIASGMLDRRGRGMPVGGRSRANGRRAPPGRRTASCWPLRRSATRALVSLETGGDVTWVWRRNFDAHRDGWRQVRSSSTRVWAS